MAFTISAALAQAMGVAAAADIGSGSILEIRSGTKPATPETAASGTLLASVTISGSWTSTGGVLTAADPAAVAISNSGTAGHFRLKTSGGVAKIDGTVGTSSADLIVGTTTFTAGANYDHGALSINIPVA
jgi:hypothetical protein